MDISNTIQPKSDQLDAVELLAGPRTFTIERVSAGSDEQPVNLFLRDFPRPWRPGKSMRRVLVSCWGADASKYVGRQVRLFCDPDVVFGGQAVGGTRIEALSHIDKPKKVPLLVSKGRSAIFVVKPLVDAAILPVNPPQVPSRGPSPTDVLMAALKTAGLNEAGPALAFISETVGREVKATKELTADEVDLVVHELTNTPAGDQ